VNQKRVVAARRERRMSVHSLTPCRIIRSHWSAEMDRQTDVRSSSSWSQLGRPGCGGGAQQQVTDEQGRVLFSIRRHAFSTHCRLCNRYSDVVTSCSLAICTQFDGAQHRTSWDIRAMSQRLHPDNLILV